MKKKTFDEQTTAEFQNFLKEFKNESDRAAIILGAAKLDIQLYQLLTKYFIPAASGTDELFDGDSPLSSFSAKINISSRLGLIDKNFARALHLIRKIRNSFAHEISGVSLESSGHRDRIRQLSSPLRDYKEYENARKSFLDDKKDISTEFRLTLCACLLRLEVAINITESISDSQGCSLIPQHWTKIEHNPEEKETNSKAE